MARPLPQGCSDAGNGPPRIFTNAGWTSRLSFRRSFARKVGSYAILVITKRHSVNLSTIRVDISCRPHYTRSHTLSGMASAREQEGSMSAQHAAGWSRREFLGGVIAVGAVGLLGVPSPRVAAEPPPETMTLRLTATPAICLAAQ